ARPCCSARTTSARRRGPTSRRFTPTGAAKPRGARSRWRPRPWDRTSTTGRGRRMTPYKQLFRHDPANGIFGDCHRTCIAALLDILPADVPHEHRPLTGEEQDTLIRRWLEQRGLTLIEFAWPGCTDIGALIANMKYAVGEHGHFMVSGSSPRGT